ncbi:hypothetical protein GCM10027589_13050 [Actinocorallia lasiicapitis]
MTTECPAMLLGRDREIDGLWARLGRSRLVSVVGAGGVGKTALASAAVAGLGTPFRWADLSALTDAELVPHAIARALLVQDDLRLPMLEAIARSVGDDPELLVLDTCEHLTGACAAAVAYLLGSCPRLTVLTTSRSRLRVAGEDVLELDRLDALAAVALLTRQVGFGAAAGELCARLGRLPLAIELAGELSRTELERLLEEPGGVLRLSTERRGVPARHRSLRAAIGWSHGLCGPDERLLWARLSALPAAFTGEFALTFCADARLPVPAAEAALRALVEVSVVQRSANAHALPEPYRVYGAGMLRELGQQDFFQPREQET